VKVTCCIVDSTEWMFDKLESNQVLPDAVSIGVKATCQHQLFVLVPVEDVPCII